MPPAKLIPDNTTSSVPVHVLKLSEPWGLIKTQGPHVRSKSVRLCDLTDSLNVSGVHPYSDAVEDPLVSFTREPCRTQSEILPCLFVVYLSEDFVDQPQREVALRVGAGVWRHPKGMIGMASVFV